VAHETETGNRRLVAYVVGREASPTALREHLRTKLPDYMVPAAFVRLEALPRLPNGKVDRAALPPPRAGEAPPDGLAPALPQGRIETSIAEIWRQVLGVERVGAEDNFFDLGGHSLALVEVRDRLRGLLEEIGGEVPTVVDLFRRPTIRSLVRHLFPEEEAAPGLRAETAPRRRGDEAVAIVGMSGRFPGAASVEELWRNLCAGVESISFFGDDELEGPVPAGARDDPRFVKAGGVLEGVELFDAAFFDFSPREAELLDPQQRLFLECAWEALERSGHDPRRHSGRIGVFAGSGINTYLIRNLLTELRMRYVEAAK
jgi:hypothetical protein